MLTHVDCMMFYDRRLGEQDIRIHRDNYLNLRLQEQIPTGSAPVCEQLGVGGRKRSSA
jgi:hypothetical protein